MEASWWERLRVKLGLVLIGRAMLSKSLIQFSVDGWNCVRSMLFTWGQTMMEAMKIEVTSLKRSIARTATLSAPNPAAGHHWPTSPPEIPGHSCPRFVWALWASLVGMGLHCKCSFTPPTIFMRLLLCPWTWVISSKSFQCHPATALSLQQG